MYSFEALLSYITAFKETSSANSLGLQINSAKILTMGHKITDIFYITDLKGKKILSVVKINQLKKQILFLLKN